MSLRKHDDSRWEQASLPSSQTEKGSTEVYESTSSQTVARYPNRWAKWRAPYREYVSEFLGTAIMIIFGNGVNCQVVLSSVTGVASSQKGSYLSISFGWAAGVAAGVWCSGGVSGGHINPAVTLALAVWRGFPWRKVPGYILAQLLGALVGAALVYANYWRAIDIFEGGQRTLATAGLFSTYALDYMSSVGCFFSEVLATAILVIVVAAMGDKTNSPPPPGLAPLVLFILILGIGACLGMETGYALNPARDLGPRLLTSMVGYGKAVYTYRNHYWIWCPIIAPIIGAQLGVMFYDGFLYQGDDSIVNRPDGTQEKTHTNRDAPTGADRV